jgi:hypothetical protein
MGTMMAETSPGTQHYVPQLILRRFADERDRIHAYDKWNRKRFLCSTRNVASEHGFYDIEADGQLISMDPLMGKLESIIAPVLNSIIEAESVSHLTPIDKRLIADFVAVQMKRTLGARERLQQLKDGVRKEMEARGVSVDPEFGDEDDLKRASVTNILDAPKAMAKHILDKTWMPDKSPPGNTFLVSDNPIVKFNMRPSGPYWSNTGLACEGVEVHMPLSPSLSMCFMCHSNMRMMCEAEVLSGVPEPMLVAALSGRPFELEAGNVTHQNSLQVQSATRFVFASNDDFSLVDRMLEANPQLAKPRYIRIM